MLVSTVDGAIDCQPIVYERCYTGEALDADGICVSERCELGAGEPEREWEYRSVASTFTSFSYSTIHHTLPYVKHLPYYFR